MIKKIVSGGQTGADQAALDLAIKLGFPHGGWIPKGRITENGPLPERYHLQEMADDSYSSRTRQNVIDSDGTLIISHGELTGGSDYTQHMAIEHHRACLHIDLNTTNVSAGSKKIRGWLDKNKIKVLNVAGPRASKDPLIYDSVSSILEKVLR